jgi:hypothetical protein
MLESSYHFRNQPVAVYCHDAGGAEQVASWIKNNPGNYTYCLEGPAVSIFAKRLGVAVTQNFDVAIKDCEYVLCSTSWASDLERNAIQESKRLGKKVFCLLDHWVNYRARFRVGTSFFFPDELWVTDKIALEICLREIPEVPVKLLEDFALTEFLSQYNLQYGIFLAQSDKSVGAVSRLLFIGENLSANRLKSKQSVDSSADFDEINAFGVLTRNIPNFSPQINHLRIRPHPSESVVKYISIIPDALRSNITIESSEGSLIQDLVNADCVVGISSMALRYALAVGKETYVCLPSEEAEPIHFLSDAKRLV